MSRTIEFTKMHGAGNDYVYVNTLRFPIDNPEQLAVLWSDRHKGIGGDGLILICPPETPEGDFRMRMFNNDGSEGRMCGNGVRCVAKYVYDNGLTQKTVINLETLSGIKVLHLHLGADGLVDTVTVDMGEAILADRSQLATPDGAMREGRVENLGVCHQGTFVSMGNPHFVCFIPDVESFDVEREGRALEVAPIFPERCNIEFATVRPDGSVRMRVWECGSGITMACGTGACATAVAAHLTGRSSERVDIVMDGGTLTIELRPDGHVYMTGPATKVFDGTISV
ncbi:MAG: diaminopimelate epimerase [Alloprevotella sp.]|nr:diaminopimelate epimerase [Alloprevotella sp.]